MHTSDFLLYTCILIFIVFNFKNKEKRDHVAKNYLRAMDLITK